MASPAVLLAKVVLVSMAVLGEASLHRGFPLWYSGRTIPIPCKPTAFISIRGLLASSEALLTTVGIVFEGY